MIIAVAELREAESRFTGEEPSSILGVESEPLVRPVGAISYDLAARRLSHNLLVRGSLHLTLECMCSRCAEWFRKPLRVPDFLRSFPLSSERESIDLTGDIREDILLALPINLVCSAECRGLCPVCGVNLNQRQCACRPQPAPAAWSVLEQLNIK